MAVALSVLLLMGCGTSYRPRETGRITFVLTPTGDEALEKDGKRYGIGGFSGDLVEAVTGNVAAEEQARNYVHQRRVGSGLLGLGIVAMLVGYTSFAFLVGPYDSDTGGPGPQARRNLLIAMTSGLLVGVVSLALGSRQLLSAEGRLYDAVNIYNDGAGRSQDR
jgi:hypothetical protein